jgi:hypothetical protein
MFDNKSIYNEVLDALTKNYGSRSELRGYLLYVSEDNKIYKQPLLYSLEYDIFYCNIPVKSFVFGAYVYERIQKILQELLNPLEAYHQVNPTFLDLKSLGRDDFRNPNETYLFNFE